MKKVNYVPKGHVRHSLSIVQKYHPQVKAVLEAKGPIDIEVTADDCAKGNQRAPSACAMARAFKREYDGAVISVSRAYLVKGTTATRYVIPESVSREIVSFDRAKKFIPGEYTLLAPTPSKTLNAQRDKVQTKYPKRKVRRTKNHGHTADIRSL
jgi:hypothetical protein